MDEKGLLNSDFPTSQIPEFLGFGASKNKNSQIAEAQMLGT